MSEREQENLAKRQERALQISSHSGALMRNEYIERSQELVAVNKNDLDDLLSFDFMELCFMGFGGFLLSGAIWLGIENYLTEGWTVLVTFCGLCGFFGLVFLGFGIFVRMKKRGKINRIFRETRQL